MSEEIIGEIALHDRAKIVFSISRWKEKDYAQLRKFINTSKYVGPTPSGLSISKDVLIPLIQSLININKSTPNIQNKEQQLARIHKTNTKDILIHLIPPVDLQTLPEIDIREHIDAPKFKGLTKKGIRFRWDNLSSSELLISVLNTNSIRFHI